MAEFIITSQADPVKCYLPQRPAIPLPGGHRFFRDCLRENTARFIEWAMSNNGLSSWFVSQTFQGYEKPDRAFMKYISWIGRLKQALGDSGGEGLRWILASEWQTREVIHFHSIVQARGMDHLRRKSWEDRWECLDSNTGFCRIYDAQKKSAPYLAKYCSKDLGGEIQWGGSWRGFTAPASVSCGHSEGLVRLSPKASRFTR
jgi:hypothetical protein